MKLKLNNKEKFFTKKKIIPLVVFMLLGMMGTGYLQNENLNFQHHMRRISNRLDEEFSVINISEVECNDHNCWNVDGIEVEFLDNKKIWVHEFNNELFADFLIDSYESSPNVFSGYKYHKYKDDKLRTFVINTNEKMTQQEFDKALDLILQELK